MKDSSFPELFWACDSFWSHAPALAVTQLRSASKKLRQTHANTQGLVLVAKSSSGWFLLCRALGEDQEPNCVFLCRHLVGRWMFAGLMGPGLGPLRKNYQLKLTSFQ